MRANLLIMATAAAALMTTQAVVAQRESNPLDPSTSPGVQPESKPSIGTPPYNPQSQTRGTQTQTNSDFVRVRELIGANVQSRDGKKAGKIEEVIVDSTGRTIQFAVMGKGGILGIGEQFLPVPWQSLKAQEGQRGYVLSIDEQKLGAAPRLQRGQYEDLDRAEFKSGLYEFYGVQPESVGATSSQTELQKGQQKGEQEEGNEGTDQLK